MCAILTQHVQAHGALGRWHQLGISGLTPERRVERVPVHLRHFQPINDNMTAHRNAAGRLHELRAVVPGHRWFRPTWTERVREKEKDRKGEMERSRIVNEF